MNFTAADDLVCHIEDFEVDRVYIGHCEAVLALKLEKSFDCRLRMDFGVVFLEDRARHTFRVFLLPVDLEWARDGILESLVAFEYFEGARDASLRAKCRIYAASCSVRVSKTLPVRERTSTCDAEPIEGGAANCNGIGGSRCVEAERARYSGGDGIGALRRMIEASGPYGRNVAQPTLHLIRNCKRRQFVLAITICILSAARTGARLSLGWQVSPGAR
jgi:hypothetical protein